MCPLPKLADGALEQLESYHWPGNVRELENIVERALILNRGTPLRFDHLLLHHREEETPFPTNPKLESLKIDDVLSKHIKGVLAVTKGKVHGPGGAAVILGINPSTLRNRMNKLGIPYKRGE